MIRIEYNSVDGNLCEHNLYQLTSEKSLLLNLISKQKKFLII
jgi:hypothetical protein